MIGCECVEIPLTIRYLGDWSSINDGFYLIHQHVKSSIIKNLLLELRFHHFCFSEMSHFGRSHLLRPCVVFASVLVPPLLWIGCDGVIS